MNAKNTLNYLTSKIRNTEVEWEFLLQLNYRFFLKDVPNLRCIDIGAHAGLHTDCMLGNLQVEKIYMFEPLSRQSQFLMNKYSSVSRVEVIRKALGNESKLVLFKANLTSPEESGLKLRSFFNSGLPQQIVDEEVLLTRLDDLQLAGPIHFIKIDTEGGEIDILKGSQKTIRRYRPLISVEYGSGGFDAYGHTKSSLFELAESMDYFLCDLLGNRFESIEEWNDCVSQFYWDYLLIHKERINEFDIIRNSLKGWLKASYPAIANAIEIEPVPHDGGYRPGKVLAFMHVPKTAGLAIRNFIISAVKPATVFEDFDRYLFGSSFDTTTSDHKIVDELPDVSCYIGHASFSGLIKACPDAQMLTVFREPYARQMSLWLFFRAMSNFTQAHGSLHQFLSDTEMVGQTDNVYVRALLWPNPLIPENYFIDPRDYDEILKLAMHNLERFEFLDVIENPLFPTRLQTWFNTPISLNRENETVACPRKFDLRKEMTPRTVRILEMSTRLDRILWRHVARKVMSEQDVFDIERASLVQATAKAASLGMASPAEMEG